eukprot:m.64275 g.64275  ORF g.64275 m.64275 type:complete len:339 (+) comp8108_c0_seq1:484-1500(+)
MKPGDSFGELALLDPTNIRTATITCKTPAEFLRVDKHEFDTILKASHEYDVRFKFNTLRDHQWFSSWSDEPLREIVNHCKRRVFRPKVVIFNGHTPGEMEYVWVLARGSARLLRRIGVHHCKKTGILQRKVGDSCPCMKCALHCQKRASVTPTQPTSFFERQKKSGCPFLPPLVESGKEVHVEKSLGQTATKVRVCESPKKELCDNGMTPPPPLVQKDDDCDGEYRNHIWITGKSLSVGMVVTDWGDATALISEGCECLLIPHSRFLKHDYGRTLTWIKEHTSMLQLTDDAIFQSFNTSQQWEHYRYSVYSNAINNGPNKYNRGATSLHNDSTNISSK